VASAPLSAICYPLAEAGAAEAGLGRATVMGLVNMCWGVAAVISPVVGGALAGAVGDRVVFAGFLVVTAGAGLAVLAAGRFLSSADEGASVDLQDLTGYER